MKLENTRENKEKFFALYWGQKVAKKLGSINLDVAYIMYHSNVEDYYLELKDLRNMNIKEAIEFTDLAKTHYSNKLITDFARLRGFAMPFENLTIEDLINYNWIKLI